MEGLWTALLIAAAERVMVSQRLSIGELFEAVLALVGGSAHVFVHVPLEMSLDLEPFVTHVAPVTVFANMSLFVFSQRLCIFEMLTTIVAK